MTGRLSFRRGSFTTNIALQTGSIAMTGDTATLFPPEELIYTFVRYQVISSHSQASDAVPAAFIVAISATEGDPPTPLPEPRSIPTGDQWLWWEGQHVTKYLLEGLTPTTWSAHNWGDRTAETFRRAAPVINPMNVFFQWSSANAATWFVNVSWLTVIALESPLP